jgi:hypothetical protein
MTEAETAKHLEELERVKHLRELETAKHLQELEKTRAELAKRTEELERLKAAATPPPVSQERRKVSQIDVPPKPASTPAKLKTRADTYCPVLGCGLYIQNIDDHEITITKITINDRDDCPVTQELFGKAFDSAVLGVGDSITLITPCGIVRAAIATNNGGVNNLTFNSAAATSIPSTVAVEKKRDILGYRLGMTKDETIDKLKAENIKCRLDLPQPTLADEFHCSLKEDRELLSINITQDLETNIVFLILYGFQKYASDRDQMDSIIEQYKPRPVDPMGLPLPGVPKIPCPRNSTGKADAESWSCELGNGIILGFGPVKNKPWNWHLYLIDTATQALLVKIDENKKFEERRQRNPPTKF